MTEKNLELYLTRKARERGWKCYKLIAKGHRGFPDRTVLTNCGRIIFVELKMPGGKVTDLQARFIRRLRDMGFEAHVARTKEDILAILDGEHHAEQN